MRKPSKFLVAAVTLVSFVERIAVASERQAACAEVLAVHAMQSEERRLKGALDIMTAEPPKTGEGQYI